MLEVLVETFLPASREEGEDLAPPELNPKSTTASHSHPCGCNSQHCYCCFEAASASASIPAPALHSVPEVIAVHCPLPHFIPKQGGDKCAQHVVQHYLLAPSLATHDPVAASVICCCWPHHACTLRNGAINHFPRLRESRSPGDLQVKGNTPLSTRAGVT
jgi:hypothetical protein